MNRLEPESLVRAFLAHPPRDFLTTASASEVPAFTADFDILTTLDRDLRLRIEAWPWHARWRRWLRLRTRFIGTTVSEYLWLPDNTAPEALAQAITAQHADACTLLVIKDIPQESPLLDEQANRFARTFAQACRDRGYVLLEGQALAWLPIDFADADEYLSRLSRSRRRDIRRKLRARERLEVEIVETGDARFRQDAEVDAFYALYLHVFEQSETQFDLLSREFFRAVLQDAASGGRMFVYRAQGRMIGWNLCFEYEGMLIDKYIGLEYPAAHEYNLYALSWMENLAYARRRGLRAYVAGWTDPEVKVSLGARLTFTRHAVLPRNPLLRLILRVFSKRFEGDSNLVHAKQNHAAADS